MKRKTPILSLVLLSLVLLTLGSVRADAATPLTPAQKQNAFNESIKSPAKPTTPPEGRIGGTSEGLPQLSPEELSTLANPDSLPQDFDKLPQAEQKKILDTRSSNTKALTKQLEKLGADVKKGDALHQEALKEYNSKVEQARRQYKPETPEQRRALEKATSEYTAKSQKIEQQYRQPAQKKLIELTNRANNAEVRSALKSAGVEVPKGTSERQVLSDLKAKAAGGDPGAKRQLSAVDSKLKSGTISETAGTKSGDPGHRGWEGDTDAGASAKRTNRMEKIANKMGLSTKGKPGYTNVKGMDLTTHKQGPMGTPGSEAHKVQIGVDASSKETYVSSAMKKGQPGKSYVEVQDHLKKAQPGLKESPGKLFKDPGKLQSMAKGTLKAIEAGQISDKKLTKIMRDNNIKGTPKQFRELLKNLKGNGSHAPDGFAKNLNPKTMKNLQGACSDTIKQAHKQSYQKAKAQIARTEGQIKSLESQAKAAKAAGNKELAGKLSKSAQAKRSSLIDSKTRMQATRTANRSAATGRPQGGPGPGTKPGGTPRRTAIKVNLKPGGGTPPPGGTPGRVRAPRPPKGPLNGGSAVKPRPPSGPVAKPAIVPVRGPVARPGVLRTPISKLVGPRVTSGFNGAMTILSIYGIYQGVKQGVNDAVADSDARGEGTIARGLRGGAYSLWYGLGFKSAADVGREEGNTFMDGYHAELYLNKIPPNSWQARKLYVKAKMLAVGASVSRIMQLDAAYDLGTETTGLLGDLWGWYKASRAESEMAARLKAKRQLYLTTHHKQQDWYCTNRPVISAPVALPPVIKSGKRP